MKRALLLALVGLAVWVPGASGHTRTVKFSVRPGQLLQWRSERAYRNRNSTDIYVDQVWVNGHRAGRNEAIDWCHLNIFGRGVVVKIYACARPRSRLYFRVASANVAPVRVAIRYRAR